LKADQSVLVVSPTHAEGERTTGRLRADLKAMGVVGSDERTFPILRNTQMTQAQRSNEALYSPHHVIVFHQNAKGYRKGQRVIVGHGRLPLEHADRFQTFQTDTLNLAPGDMIRITQNGTTADGQHRLNNGSLYNVGGFDRDGNIVLENKWVIDRDFGHLA